MLYRIRYRPRYGSSISNVRKTSISYTISYYDIEIYLVDIEKYKNSISMSPFVTIDIEKCNLRYRIRSISIHDIDCKNLRYRCAFDIERLRYRIFRSISCVRHTISGCQGSRCWADHRSARAAYGDCIRAVNMSILARLV